VNYNFIVTNKKHIRKDCTKFKQVASIAILMLMSFFLFSCAETHPVTDDSEYSLERQAVTSYPAYNGPKTPIAVLPMGLSQRAVERYPHLLEKSVGLGLHNILSDALYRTKRFRFVEDKESILQESFKRQRLSMSGVVDEQYAIQVGKMLGAQKVIYGEVFDYSEGKEEQVVGVSTTSTLKIRVGVQIRLVDLETLEYIPASSIKYGTDWGETSEKAIEAAVLKIVSNL